MRTSLLARSVPILAALAFSACDNVIWGGADVQIVPPPPPASSIQIEADATVFAEFGLPTGTVLFHVKEGAGGTQLIPVAEVGVSAIRPIQRPAGVSPQAFEDRFRQTVLPIGAQFDVFRRGSRVGTFVAQANGPVTACGVPTVTGNVTVVAAAVDAGEYLAFRQGLSPTVRGEFSPPQITGSIRTYAAIVAERLILGAGLPRPRTWPGAQRDLQAIEILPGGHPEMAATYLVGDELAVGPGNPEGYSVFYIADFETRRGYMPVYSEIHEYRTSGKAAPRLLDYVVLDEQDVPDLITEVFGASQSWYDVIGLRNGQWTKIVEGAPCS